ncbi:MAG: MFS transporter [Bifidobacteriaceae bacterium]|jgi:hypothetical protein|nr:MFS transporter [Bifidobacteriaceae bacterium]
MERYKSILKYQSSWKFSLAGALARLSFSSTLLALLYTIKHIYNSWVLASIISGSMLIISSIMTPLTAFLIDKYSQNLIGFLFTYLKVSGMIAIIILCNYQAPLFFVTLAASLICFFSVPYGSMVRRRWNLILKNQSKDKINTAFALENTFDNLIYIIGPILVTTIIYCVAPQLALLVPALSNFLGGTLLLIQKSTQPPKNKNLTFNLSVNFIKNKWNPIYQIKNNSKQIKLVSCLILLFSFYGSLDILARHITILEGTTYLNGTIISTVSIFGILSSFLYPYLKKGWGLYCTIFALGIIFLPLSCQNTYLFWLDGAICGFALSPIYILADLIINKLPKQQNKTLNFSLIGVANSLGNALGIYIIGFTIDTNITIAASSISLICLIGIIYTRQQKF